MQHPPGWPLTKLQRLMNKTLLGLALALGCVGSEAWTTDSLVVIGPVNSDDFVTMWNCAFYGRTTIFNLEKAQLEGNEIPNHAFFNGEIQNVPNKKKYLNLKRVILPEGITAIVYDAFEKSGDSRGDSRDFRLLLQALQQNDICDPAERG